MGSETSYVEDKSVNEIKRIYNEQKEKIISRIEDFEDLIKHGTDSKILSELIFCILTPQSNAKLCWDAVMRINKKGLLVKGSSKQILKELNNVRFKYKKSEFVAECRGKFLHDKKIQIKDFIHKFNDVLLLREWLVENIKGIGYKEAGHFLRNIGLGSQLAILDRHILKNLELYQVIEKIPVSISKKKYIEIEKQMILFSKKVKIPMSHLDLVFWYKEKKEIFK